MTPDAIRDKHGADMMKAAKRLLEEANKVNYHRMNYEAAGGGATFKKFPGGDQTDRTLKGEVESIAATASRFYNRLHWGTLRWRDPEEGERHDAKFDYLRNPATPPAAERTG